MNINWQQETNKIKVPETAVTQAITRGLNQATKRQQSHRKLELMLTVAALLSIILFNPLTIQAGGVIPAIHQLLDKKNQRTHNFDPTMNKIFSGLSDVSAYQSVNSSAVKEDGLTIQVRGVMTSAGIKAFVIDYNGARINPAALRRQDVHVTLNQHQSVIDVEQNYGQIALGHYRQFIAFYVNGDSSASNDTIDIRIGMLMDLHRAFHYPQSKLSHFPQPFIKLLKKLVTLQLAKVQLIKLIQLHIRLFSTIRCHLISEKWLSRQLV
mgnify:CR=1 FL=1